ncbi:MAG: hypothetical protein U1E65_03515 [Myxococcota bacterium]
MTETGPDKGGRAEEQLREYFISAGYFAVRGVPVAYDDVEITDIDLWLYLRPSPLSRERVNVDAKNRSTPKALERILWAQGLRSILGLESCIVATTDVRPVVKAFGREHGVLVLDGAFLAKLSARRNADRISEEELMALLGPSKDDKLLGSWRERLKAARARLVSQLEFDGCNGWLEDARYFLEQMTSGRAEAACRLAYLVVSYFLVGVDYSLRRLAFDEPDVRRQALVEGFRFGSRGREQIEQTVTTAAQLVARFAPDAKSRASNLRMQVVGELEGMPVEMLADHFMKNDVAGELFSLARAFEARAYSSALTRPGQLEPSCQAVLGLIADFYQLDRRRLLA